MTKTMRIGMFALMAGWGITMAVCWLMFLAPADPPGPDPGDPEWLLLDGVPRRSGGFQVRPPLVVPRPAPTDELTAEDAEERRDDAAGVVPLRSPRPLR